MKTNKISGILCYVSAVLWYLIAVIKFVNSDNSSGVIFLALGSTSLCLGSTHIVKSKNDTDDKEQK